MAFMDRNRRLNGAPEPSATARGESAEQREQETLSTNPTSLGAPQHRTFQPNLETEEAINRRHYRSGLDESEWPGYESMIPLGPKMGEPDDAL